MTVENAVTPQQRLVEVFKFHTSIDAPPVHPWHFASWAWATNGHLLVALLDDGTPTEPTPDSKLKGATRYLTEVPAAMALVPMAALRTFAGKVEPPKDCPDCDGTGYDEFSEPIKCKHCGQYTQRECGECGGDGLAGPVVRLGRIVGVPLDLQLLAFALTFVPMADECAIGSITSASVEVKNAPALVVSGDTWRIVVMSVREPGKFVPVFLNGRTESPEADNAVAGT